MAAARDRRGRVLATRVPEPTSCSGIPRPAAGRSTPRPAGGTRRATAPAHGSREAAPPRAGGRFGSRRAARAPAGHAAGRRGRDREAGAALGTNRTTAPSWNWTLSGTSRRTYVQRMSTVTVPRPSLRPPLRPLAGAGPPAAAADRTDDPDADRGLRRDDQLLPAAAGGADVRDVAGRRRLRSRPDHRRADVHLGGGRVRHPGSGGEVRLPADAGRRAGPARPPGAGTARRDRYRRDHGGVGGPRPGLRRRRRGCRRAGRRASCRPSAAARGSG